MLSFLVNNSQASQSDLGEDSETKAESQVPRSYPGCGSSVFGTHSEGAGQGVASISRHPEGGWGRVGGKHPGRHQIV